ncbi:MAG TPA: aminopeptidase P family N-terminal domain-containing protein, partial [Candidatus Lokiarchaeia archaeon]|nr:aminopeptidase P family N-terminal domain-containing protein [Candidatus Lokiarchaeia archaeon]
MNLHIDSEEYSQRINKLRTLIEAEGLDVFIAGTVDNTYYLSALDYRPYERVFLVVVPLRDEPFLFVPKLEEEHAKQVSSIADVRSYSEYPAKAGQDWFVLLREYLKDYNNIGIESSLPIGVAQSIHGLENDTRVIDLVEQLRIVKSPKEVEKIRFASKVADKIAKRLLKNSKEGAPLLSIIAPVSQELYS